jgi:hypothetical protein
LTAVPEVHGSSAWQVIQKLNKEQMLNDIWQPVYWQATCCANVSLAASKRMRVYIVNP